MKRTVWIFTALALLLTGCGMHRTESTDPQTTDPVLAAADAGNPAATAQNIRTFTDHNGTSIRPDMERYSEDARVLTGDDIWISSSRCGYLGQMPRNARWIIRSQLELSVFNLTYDMHLELPDEYPNNGDDVEKPYDFGHDAMLIEYVEVPSTGYDLKAGGVLIDGDTMQFVMSADSRSPDKDEAVGEMMDGFLWQAALPQDAIPPRCDEWIYIDPQPEPHEDEETEDTGGYYMKPASDADVVTDAANGIRYVKNQLLVSCEPDTDRKQVEQLAGDVGAEIVGYIALTSDYQFEWAEDKTTDELQAIADRMNGYPFVLNVTLNMVHDISVDD